MLESNENYKKLGLLASLISIFAGSYMVWTGPRDKTKSVSFHAAAAKKSIYRLYAIAFMTATILFYFFCIFWFIPTLHLPFGFSILLTIMTLLLVLTALIPQSGKGIKMHVIVAYGFAFVMMLLLIFIVISPHVSFLARTITGMTFVWMAIVWYLYFFSAYKKAIRAHYLFYQSSYILLFFLSILAATYIR